MFIIFRFLFFATPCCCGEYEAIICLLMASYLQYELNAAEMISPPRFVRKQQIAFVASFLTCFFKALEVVQHFTILLKQIQPHISTKIIHKTQNITFLLLGVIGPHKSIWMSWSFLRCSPLTLFGKRISMLFSSIAYITSTSQNDFVA